MTTFLGRALLLCATIGMLFLMTGCGMLSAVANPKVAWAFSDPAPMSVVVRRADAAEATAKQVDRVLTATPCSPDADWLKSVGPKPEDAAADMKALTQDPMYMQSRARVVAAEVWLRTLSDVQSTGGSSANILAIVSSDLGDQYAAVLAKEQEVAQLDAQIATEKEARDAKGVSDADKKAHDKNVDDLKAQKSKKEDEVDPLKKKFLASVKDAAAQTPADKRDAVAAALVNLRQAVDDASIADGAAALRYPMAITSMLDSVKQMVPVYVADIIEERTGKRPSMQGFKPDISLNGTDVSITINGLSKDDMGKISIGDLTTQTIGRTKDWVVHTLGLLGAISSTKDHLNFEQDTLDAMLDGFAKNGWKRIEPVQIPLATDPKVMTATAKIRPHVKPSAAATTPAIGVAAAQPATPAAAAVAPAPAPSGKSPKATAMAKVTAKKPVAAAPAAPAATPGPPAPMRIEDFK
jgi:hypothetical protein